MQGRRVGDHVCTNTTQHFQQFFASLKMLEMETSKIQFKIKLSIGKVAVTVIFASQHCTQQKCYKDRFSFRLTRALVGCLMIPF